MKRHAGDIINAALREGKLAANRAEPVGEGVFGVVYASDVPGNVMKQVKSSDRYKQIEKEANMQAIAAEMGIAPRVAGLETFPSGIGNRIEMQDIRQNFETRGEPNQFPEGMDAVRVNQQLGQLALKGVRVEDRHTGNVVYNKMTGRPMQIDFGIAGKMGKAQSAAYLAEVTAEGFEAAGIGEMGDILRATVMDYLEGGQVREAMDVAKQGFSRLQKIKTPLTRNTKDPEDLAFEEMLEMMNRQMAERGLQVA
jgi:hypothetical protein